MEGPARRNPGNQVAKPLFLVPIPAEFIWKMRGSSAADVFQTAVVQYVTLIDHTMRDFYLPGGPWSDRLGWEG